MLLISWHEKLHLGWAILSLTAGSAGVAIADVTIDACVAQNSIKHHSLAADMQSLCALSSSIGALLGFFISGIFVHLIGPKVIFVSSDLNLLLLHILLIWKYHCILFSIVLFFDLVGCLWLVDDPCWTCIFSWNSAWWASYAWLSLQTGNIYLLFYWFLFSSRSNISWTQVDQKFLDAGKAMWTTLKCPYVWKPCVYMYLSISLCLDIHEGMFYWYTDSKGGPSLSQVFQQLPFPKFQILKTTKGNQNPWEPDSWIEW